MNTQEIDRFLRQRLPDFDGVFSIDTLPERPRLLVCNTDPSDEPGRPCWRKFECLVRVLLLDSNEFLLGCHHAVVAKQEGLHS